MLKQKSSLVKQLNSLRYPALEMQGKGAVLNTSRGFKTRLADDAKLPSIGGGSSPRHITTLSVDKSIKADRSVLLRGPKEFLTSRNERLFGTL
jgi:hypothetical protein